MSSSSAEMTTHSSLPCTLIVATAGTASYTDVPVLTAVVVLTVGLVLGLVTNQTVFLPTSSSFRVSVLGFIVSLVGKIVYGVPP